jgi:alpha-mannosidase
LGLLTCALLCPGNEWNRIPHNTFSWLGLDGSDVIAHFPSADNYSCEGSVAEIVK